MPFEPPGSFDLVALEERVLSRWDSHDVFARSLEQRTGAPEWVFYEGPPTANGRPGIHHVWARLFKDLYPRFHTMRGRYVARKGGWDCHGLPVEVEVEKELGFAGKDEIEAYGIEAFNARCRESVQRYVGDFEELTRRIGMWIDTDDAYWTLDNSYIESVWWLFRRIWDAGLIYEGFKVVPYCGRCGTALSSHELGQPGAYRDITEPSVYVRFPLVDDDADLLVWTTTPWTLVSNIATAVSPDVEYARVRAPGGVPAGRRDLIMAAARVPDVLGQDAEIVELLGAPDLVGRHYARPFDTLPVDGEAHRVVAADFVTIDEGSGIVHLAPAFGEIDREVAEAEGLPVLNPVDAEARFGPEVPAHEGTFVKDADAALVRELDERGLLEKVVDYTHSYPHCWRCSTPLIYWGKPTWFAATSSRREALLRENETIGWHPGHIKHGRFGDWLENNVDWALSRDRFWGTPIPVWRCDECGHDVCVGSVEELSGLAGRDLGDLDLHRPFVDDVTVSCPECDGSAHRVGPVLDAWFDSGSMPAAQLHYPFEGADTFEKRFPADFICEAIDQTRGWFYSLLAVNTLAFDATPYRNVVCLALVVDRAGQKMSKSKGNVIDPWSILDSRGADALRWYFFAAGSPWTQRRVHEDGIDESTRRFLLTLWNTLSFFVTYANLEGFEPPADGTSVAAPTHPLDRWMRSRLHHTIAAVTDALESFDALSAAQHLERLVDDTSNWYVRRSRPRFWRSDAADHTAHATLHEVLSTLARLLAPFTPFVADEIHHTLSGSARYCSVHLEDWPEVDDTALDPGLEDEMSFARSVVSLGRAAREEAKVRVRQPLPRALVLTRDPLSDTVVAEVAAELNVKSVEAVDSLEGLLDYSVTPNFRALGPRLGKQLPAVKEALAALDGALARRSLDDTGSLTVHIGDDTVELGPDDVEIRAREHEELALAEEGSLAVALDLSLTDELIAEGRAREIARALNEERKKAGFDIADRVTVRLAGPDALVSASRVHADWIAGEILAVAFEVLDDAPERAREVVVAGEPMWVVLEISRDD
ncbi:MAG: isoleucine--tRNA ligase [Acidimicrobiia bacterium]